MKTFDKAIEMDKNYYDTLETLADKADYLRSCKYTIEIDILDLEPMGVPDFNGIRVNACAARTEKEVHENVKRWLSGFPTNK